METEYPTYQYLTGNVENEVNPVAQYIVLSDGSLAIDKNNMPQYEIVGNNKEVVETAPCPVYNVNDVNTQQCYPDLSVPPELEQIPANSDQPVPISNEYENCLSISNSEMEMVMVDAEEHVNDIDIDEEIHTNIETENNIDLSEEQCDTLQEKGLVLFETNDKVFFLDSSGLHDVTDDPKLVNKLRDESQMESFNNHESSYDIETVMMANDIGSHSTSYTSDENNEYIETEQIQDFYGNECDAIQENGCNTIQENEWNAIQETNSIEPIYQELGQERSYLRTMQDSSVQTAEPLMDIPTEIEFPHENIGSFDNLNRPTNVVLNTQFLLKDIPREVILGRTVNGKNLVARVIKGKGFFKRVRDKPKKNTDGALNEDDFEALVKSAALGTVQVSPEDIAAAEALVSELLQMQEYGPTLPEERLIITKTIREENEDKEIVKQHDTAIITGRVVGNETEEKFVHDPDLLQQYANSDDVSGAQNDETDSGHNMFLHIDLTETKAADNISRVDLAVNKKCVGGKKKKKVVAKQRPEFRCRGCRKKFTTKKSAKRHEQRSCTVFKYSKNGEPLSVNTNKINEQQDVNTRIFKCKKCNEKFVKLKEFLVHTRTHGATTNHECDQEEDDRRCKLCSNRYKEPSQLTQHILEVHINNEKPKRYRRIAFISYPNKR